MQFMDPQSFWDLMERYHAAVFPVQYIFSVAAILLVVLMARRPGPRLNGWVNLFLTICYLWIAIVYFLVHNRELSVQGRYFQPILMFVIAAFFAMDLLLKKTDFRFRGGFWRSGIGLFFMAYSIVGYPIIGALLGHPYAAAPSGGTSVWVPILGTYPCPTTVFSLGLLSVALPRADRKAMIPLLLWALFSIGGPPMRRYGAYEDLGLFAAGIFGLVMLLTHPRARRA